MTQRYLKLDLNGLSLTLTAFVDERFPRILMQSGELSRTASGNLVMFGSAIELPHLWDFSVYLSPNERNQLQCLYNEHVRLRRNLSSSFKIKLTDTTYPFQEVAPRTRAKAPAPFDAEEAPYSGFVSYHAQYWAVFAAPIEWTYKGSKIQAALSLQETEEKVSP
jgi:hypothetical protein